MEDSRSCSSDERSSLVIEEDVLPPTDRTRCKSVLCGSEKKKKSVPNWSLYI